VFFEVAFIVSVILGFGGRALVMLMTNLLESPGASMVELKAQQLSTNTNNVRTVGRKRVKIEE